MTDPFETFIQSDAFKLEGLTTVSCNMVHPFVKVAMQDYLVDKPVKELISDLQAQIAACTANEFMDVINNVLHGPEAEEGEIIIAPVTGEDLESILKNAIAIAFSTFNITINKNLFSADETANPRD